MLYEIIQPPFTLAFQSMSKTELRAYEKWYHEVTPERRAVLSKAVSSTPRFEAWKADLSPVSLELLGQWCHDVFAMRSRTQAEMREDEVPSQYSIVAPTETLTNKSISISMDIDMYLGSVIVNSMPGTSWTQDMAKRSIDYGQPVIKGFGQVTFNPLHMCTTMAFGMLAGTRGPNHLTEIYDIWARMRA